MLGREAIAALIPHQGAMCLLERVIEWDKDRIVLATSTHRAPDNPLRHETTSTRSPNLLTNFTVSR